MTNGKNFFDLPDSMTDVEVTGAINEELATDDGWDADGGEGYATMEAYHPVFSLSQRLRLYASDGNNIALLLTPRDAINLANALGDDFGKARA